MSAIICTKVVALFVVGMALPMWVGLSPTAVPASACDIAISMDSTYGLFTDDMCNSMMCTAMRYITIGLLGAAILCATAAMVVQIVAVCKHRNAAQTTECMMLAGTNGVMATAVWACVLWFLVPYEYVGIQCVSVSEYLVWAGTVLAFLSFLWAPRGPYTAVPTE